MKKPNHIRTLSYERKKVVKSSLTTSPNYLMMELLREIKLLFDQKQISSFLN